MIRQRSPGRAWRHARRSGAFSRRGTVRRLRTRSKTLCGVHGCVRGTCSTRVLYTNRLKTDRISNSWIPRRLCKRVTTSLAGRDRSGRGDDPPSFCWVVARSAPEARGIAYRPCGRIGPSIAQGYCRITFSSNRCVSGNREPAMLTGMRRGSVGDLSWRFSTPCSSKQRRTGTRRPVSFLEALHYFTVHNITWRALPAGVRYRGTAVWKRFWRLSRTGACSRRSSRALAESSQDSAHLIQMFDSTMVRAHVSAAGAKGGSKIRRSAVPAAGSRAKSTSRRTSTAYRSPSI